MSKGWISTRCFICSWISWGVVKRLRHWILIPACEGSNPSSPAISNPYSWGVVKRLRLWILNPACEGSNPSSPANFNFQYPVLGSRQVVKTLDFDSSMRRFESFLPSQPYFLNFSNFKILFSNNHNSAKLRKFFYFDVPNIRKFRKIKTVRSDSIHDKRDDRVKHDLSVS